MNSIDVIIPSFRLREDSLFSIISMNKPTNYKVRFLIIQDNPSRKISNNFRKHIDDDNILLIQNKTNSGSSFSRNVGINNSNAQWILFIDDDVKHRKDLLIKYTSAIQKYPNEIGFFGETIFPNPTTFFTKGVVASDILTFFFIARYYRSLKWAPTSNVLIKSSVIKEIRFKDIFPKNGGGEDIDFFLQIYKNENKELLCLKSTEVLHEWWFDQKRNYTRFVRWSYGDALLHDSFPQFTYYNFPNIVEILFLLSPLCIILGFFYNTPIPLVALICGSVSGELIIECVRLLFLKKKLKSLFFLESVLIRASNDVGRLGRVIKLKKIKLLFQRFDHFCDGKHIRYQKTWSCLKFLCSVILSLLFAYANGR